MTQDLMKQQAALESKMRGDGYLKVTREHTKAVARGNLSDTKVGSRWIDNYLLKVSDAIAYEISKAISGRSGRRHMGLKLIMCEGRGVPKLHPSIYAYFTIKGVLNRVCRVDHNSRGCTQTAAAAYIGGLIDDELVMQNLGAAEKALKAKLAKDWEGRDITYEKKREYLHRAIKDNNIDVEFWDRGERVRVGLKLLEIFRNTTGDIRFFTKREGKKTYSYVEPCKTFVERIATDTEIAANFMTVYLPCVIPPQDWGDHNIMSGTYHTDQVRPFPIIKRSKKVLRDALRGADLTTVYDSLNVLQRTPWRVNVRVLDAMRWGYDNGFIDSLPKPDLIEPDTPESMGITLKFIEYKGRQVPDKKDPDTLSYLSHRMSVHEKNRSDISKRIAILKTFRLADDYSQWDKHYYPVDLDSRGRAYYKPATLNPQGADLSKGVLEFAEGKPLGTAEAVGWLAIHGANSYGEDKLSLEDRMQWVMDNSDRIASTAEDPRADLWWTEADSPAQFLAFCFEWHGYILNGLDHVSHIHVDVDATCSGLQHFSAMLRDAEGGFHVNLTTNKERQDVYMKVADIAMGLIKEDTDPDTVQLRDAWIKHGIHRKYTKRTVMVVPYAGTFQACLRYVDEAIPQVIPEWYGKRHDFIVYGARKVWAAIPQVIPAATGAMGWLSKIAKLVAKSQPESKRIEWTVPTGLPVHQFKFKNASQLLVIEFEGKCVERNIRRDTAELDTRKMGSSVAPSFVHSLDAAHMMMTMAAASKQIPDLCVAAVHDSFGCHASDMGVFNRVIREQFVELYQNDVLEDFLEAAKPLISEKLQGEIPEMPHRGSLDLNQVLSSTFFFS